MKNLAYLVAAVSASAILMPPEPASAAAHHCGEVGNSGDTGAAIHIRARHTTCHVARRVPNSAVKSGNHPGWAVKFTGRQIKPSNVSEVVLRRRHGRIYMGYVGGSYACYPDL